jgi:hypothetical protein
VNGFRFRVYFLLLSSVNSQSSQTKTTLNVSDDKLGGGDHFSAAEKYKSRIADTIGLEEREHCALVGVFG